MPEIIPVRIQKLLDANLLPTGNELQKELKKETQIAPPPKPASPTPPPTEQQPAQAAEASGAKTPKSTNFTLNIPSDPTAPEEDLDTTEDSKQIIETIYEINPKAKDSVFEFINTLTSFVEEPQFPGPFDEVNFEPRIIEEIRKTREWRTRQGDVSNLHNNLSISNRILQAQSIPLPLIPELQTPMSFDQIKNAVHPAGDGFSLLDIFSYPFGVVASAVHDFSNVTKEIIHGVGALIWGMPTQIYKLFTQNPITTISNVGEFLEHLVIDNTVRWWNERIANPYNRGGILGVADDILRKPFSFVFDSPATMVPMPALIGIGAAKNAVVLTKTIRAIKTIKQAIKIKDFTSVKALAKRWGMSEARIRDLLADTPGLGEALQLGKTGEFVKMADRINDVLMTPMIPYTVTLQVGARGLSRLFGYGGAFIPVRGSLDFSSIPKAIKSFGKYTGSIFKIHFGKDDITLLDALDKYNVKPLFVYNFSEQPHLFAAGTRYAADQGLIAVNIKSITNGINKIRRNQGQLSLSGQAMLNAVLGTNGMLAAFNGIYISAASAAKQIADKALPHIRKISEKQIRKYFTNEDHFKAFLDGRVEAPQGFEAEANALKEFWKLVHPNIIQGTDFNLTGSPAQHKKFLSFISTIQNDAKLNSYFNKVIDQMNIKAEVFLSPEIWNNHPNSAQIKEVLDNAGQYMLVPKSGGRAKDSMRLLNEKVAEQAILEDTSALASKEFKEVLEDYKIPEKGAIFKHDLARALGVKSGDIKIYEVPLNLKREGEIRYKLIKVRVRPKVATEYGELIVDPIKTTQKVGRRLVEKPSHLEVTFHPNHDIWKDNPYTVSYSQLPTDDIVDVDALKVGDVVRVQKREIPKFPGEKTLKKGDVIRLGVVRSIDTAGGKKIATIEEMASWEVRRKKGGNILVQRPKKDEIVTSFSITDDALRKTGEKIFRTPGLDIMPRAKHDWILRNGIKIAEDGTINTEMSLYDWLYYETEKYLNANGIAPAFITDSNIINFSRIRDIHTGVVSKLTGAKHPVEQNTIYKDFATVLVSLYNDMIHTERVKLLMRGVRNQYGIYVVKEELIDSILSQKPTMERLIPAEFREAVRKDTLRNNKRAAIRFEKEIERKLMDLEYQTGRKQYIIAEQDLASFTTPDTVAGSILQRRLQPISFNEIEAIQRFREGARDSFVGTIYKSSLGKKSYLKEVVRFTKDFRSNYDKLIQKMLKDRSRFSGVSKETATEILDAIDRGIYPQMVVPTEVGARLGQIISPSASKILDRLKWLQSLMIPSMLLLNTGFHINNLMGAVMMSVMGGVRFEHIIGYWMMGGRTYIPFGLTGQAASYFTKTTEPLPTSSVIKNAWRKMSDAGSWLARQIDSIINPYMVYVMEQNMGRGQVDAERMKKVAESIGESAEKLQKQPTIIEGYRREVAQLPEKEKLIYNRLVDLQREEARLMRDLIDGESTYRAADIQQSKLAAINRAALEDLFTIAVEQRRLLENLQTAIKEENIIAPEIKKIMAQEIVRISNLQQELVKVAAPMVSGPEPPLIPVDETGQLKHLVEFYDRGVIGEYPYVIMDARDTVALWHGRVKPLGEQNISLGEPEKRTPIANLLSKLYSLKSSLRFAENPVFRRSRSIKLRANTLTRAYDRLIGLVGRYLRVNNEIFQRGGIDPDSIVELRKTRVELEKEIDTAISKFVNDVMPKQSRLYADALSRNLTSGLKEVTQKIRKSIAKVGDALSDHAINLVSKHRARAEEKIAGDIDPILSHIREMQGRYDALIPTIDELHNVATRASKDITSSLSKSKSVLPDLYKSRLDRLTQIHLEKREIGTQLKRLARLRKPFNDMAKEYFKVMSQYLALSPFERQVISSVIPFWGFYKTAGQHFISIAKNAPYWLVLGDMAGEFLNDNEFARQFGIDTRDNFIYGYDFKTGKVNILRTRGSNFYGSVEAFVNVGQAILETMVKIPYYLTGGRIDPNYYSDARKIRERLRNIYRKAYEYTDIWETLGALQEGLGKAYRELPVLLQLKLLGIFNAEDPIGLIDRPPEAIIDQHGRVLKIGTKLGKPELEEDESILPHGFIPETIRRFFPMVRRIENIIYPYLKRPKRPLFSGDPYLVAGREIPYEIQDVLLQFLGIPYKTRNLYQLSLQKAWMDARLLQNLNTQIERLPPDSDSVEVLKLLRAMLETNMIDNTMVVQ